MISVRSEGSRCVARITIRWLTGIRPVLEYHDRDSKSGSANSARHPGGTSADPMTASTWPEVSRDVSDSPGWETDPAGRRTPANGSEAVNVQRASPRARISLIHSPVGCAQVLVPIRAPARSEAAEMPLEERTTIWSSGNCRYGDTASAISGTPASRAIRYEVGDISQRSYSASLAISVIALRNGPSTVANSRVTEEEETRPSSSAAVQPWAPMTARSVVMASVRIAAPRSRSGCLDADPR